MHSSQAQHIQTHKSGSELFFLLKKKTLKIINFIYLFLAVLGLLCCLGFSPVVVSKGYSLVVVCGLLISLASLVSEH